MPRLVPEPLAGAACLEALVTDWREAGLKADAHRVRDLYRAAFNSESKLIARGRVIEALRAAGVTTVLDLWGGGGSAEQLVAAGFRVIAVENGSMEIDDRGQLVSRTRKRRALEYAAREGGYEARWGSVETFASEADGAYLDFCGPWSVGARRAVTASRHMKAVAVTLTPDHDLASGAASSHERQMAYQLFLKMAWSERPRWEYMSSGGGTVRRLLDYRRSRGYSVFLYLLSHGAIRIPPMKLSDREKTRPDMRERHNALKRAYYHRMTPEQKRVWHARQLANKRARLAADPEKRTRDLAVQRASLIRRLHRGHLAGAIPLKPCPLCLVGPAPAR